jgi:cobaltochelatase CobS
MSEPAAIAARKALTQGERALLRRAVSQYHLWDSWRATVLDANGKPVNTSTISVDQLYAAADVFGIDVDDVIAGAADIDRRRASAASAGPSVNGNTNAKATNDVDQLASILQSILSRPAVDEDTVRAIVKAELEAVDLGAPVVTTIDLTRPDGSLVTLTGHYHPQFQELLELVSDKENVWISGPTGSGKTHACRQVAEAMGLNFYLQGAMSQPHEFLGFISVGTGAYITTPFRQAFEHGGVVLFDECDASDPSVTLAMNAMLANGHGVFPDCPQGIPKHADCYVIAAANTWGSGATADFVGRNRLDAAFMSRFPSKLSWGYDEAFELALYPGEFTKMVQRARRKAAENRGLKVVIDPRHSKAGSKMVARGKSLEYAAERTYLAGLTDDQRRALR